MDPEIPIRVRDVSKIFHVRHNASHSLKSKLMSYVLPRYREEIEEFHVLNNVNLDVKRGTCMGLVGLNGSGKSSLLRLIAGIIPLTAGSIELPADARIGTMIALGVGFSEELSGAENIYLNASLYGFSREEVEEHYQEIVEFSELGSFIDTPLKNYSSGMYARLGFSIIAFMPMDIMLIDEVLAVGDEKFAAKSLKRMNELKASGRTIVFVSHSVPDILSFCDEACLIHKGYLLGVNKPQTLLDAYRELLYGNIDSAEVTRRLA